MLYYKDCCLGFFCEAISNISLDLCCTFCPTWTCNSFYFKVYSWSLSSLVVQSSAKPKLNYFSYIIVPSFISLTPWLKVILENGVSLFPYFVYANALRLEVPIIPIAKSHFICCAELVGSDWVLLEVVGLFSLRIVVVKIVWWKSISSRVARLAISTPRDGPTSLVFIPSPSRRHLSLRQEINLQFLFNWRASQSFPSFYFFRNGGSLNCLNFFCLKNIWDGCVLSISSHWHATLISRTIVFFNINIFSILCQHYTYTKPLEVGCLILQFYRKMLVGLQYFTLFFISKYIFNWAEEEEEEEERHWNCNHSLSWPLPKQLGWFT